MARFGFTGPTYTSQSPLADAERSMNLYPEIIEATHGKSQMALYGSPGLKTFCDLTKTETKVPGLFAQNGRCFMAGVYLYEIFADGTKNKIGQLGVSNQPSVIVANQIQLLILVGGNLWVYYLQTGILVAVNMAQFPGPIAQIGFSDGFFIALVANSQTLQISNLLDGTTWQGLNTGGVGVFPDNVVSMLVDHRELWLWGSKASAVYYDTGSTFFPFSPIPGVYLETGSAAIYAPVQLDNSVMWLSLDARGSLIAYRAQGYVPERISNHAVEYRWSTYPTIGDVIGYSFVDQGHSFWHLYFPSANASWRYDVENGWHEVGEWTGNGYLAHRSRCHAYAFGKHLVGDTLTGVIYDQSINYGTYDGRVIRRLRVSPTVSKENAWILHRKLQLDCETGIETQPPLTGPSPANRAVGINQWVLPDQNGITWTVQINDVGEYVFTQLPGLVAQTIYLLDTVTGTPWLLAVDSTDIVNPYITVTLGVLTPYVQSIAKTSQPFITTGGFGSVAYVENGVLSKTTPDTSRGPVVFLRFSDDNAHTWSNYHAVDMGKSGQYSTRVIWRRLGRSRNRTYEVTYSDPTPFRIVEADLDATPGFEPVERLTNLINKGA